MKKGFLASSDPKCSKIRPPQRLEPRTKDGKYTFDHFELERLLGSGNFSEVFEATEKGTSNSYALKVFNRVSFICGEQTFAAHHAGPAFWEACRRCASPDFVIQNDVMRLNKVADVRMERHAMLRLNDPGHPNVIRLLETFKDDFRVCFVYELAEWGATAGGELWEHVKYAGLMDKGWALRVISQVVSAVEYLHSKNIVHRDLKAENFVLTRDGVVKLIDLGTAVDLDHPEVEAPGLGVNRSVGSTALGCSQRAIRRPTFRHYVGTPQFMPPEAIKNKDSGKLRDLWSLGCTIFQILSGNPPFSGSTDYFILLRVEAGNLEFPLDFDPLARDLVEKLLVADPCKRLGANGFEEVKSHPYFSPECYENSSYLGRLFPSLQELCIRKILKRFHSLVMDAMDKERQSRYSYEQAPKATSNFNKEDSVLTQKREGLYGKRADAEGEDYVAETCYQTSSSNDDSEEPGSGSKTQSEGPQIGVEFEFANRLLDEVLPRGLRDQPQKNMSPHLRFLICRLEYFLYTQSCQFSKECSLADEWDRKHSHQYAAVDEESVGSDHG